MNTMKMIRDLNALGGDAALSEDGRCVFLSAENGDNLADYYGEFTGGDMWIAPKVLEIAARHGGFVEWENAGCLSIWEA